MSEPSDISSKTVFLSSMLSRNWSTEDNETVSPTETEPPSGCSAPLNILKSVDLPAPFKPKTPILAPGKKLKEISFNTKPYCNQIELNPFLLRNPVVEYCNQNEIKIVAHSPLAKGEKLNYKKLVDFSKKYNASPAQIMLQWNLQQNNGVIPRSKEFNHIQQNINCNFKLEEEDVKYLNTFDCKFSTHPKYL